MQITDMYTPIVNAILLIAGLVLFAHRRDIANRLASELCLAEFGLSKNEALSVWLGVTQVGGLALVLTGLLRFVA